MRLIIVSNRLPITIQGEMPDKKYTRSIGGLVTGIESYTRMIEQGQTPFTDYLWVGWPGSHIEKEERDRVFSACVQNFRFYPVFLDQRIINEYYYDFCNTTIWPLFHYFPNYVKHNVQAWESYKSANEQFYETLKSVLKKDDVVWIHDYHLMLLPALIRKDFPDIAINFFLHIPFPTVDIFRHLSRQEYTGILQGLLGANVIGFHTYGYAQDFLQCVFKLLKLSASKHEIVVGKRKVKVEIFPMGIDYHGISKVAESDACRAIRDKIVNDFAGYKRILSIDRLDYTKGILNRLIAFDRMLREFPEWREKVVMMLIVAPSRREIDSYQQIKRDIDEWVGNINGSYGTNTWVPVIYQYKQLDLLELCALYGASDIALVTPLRDGMNLMAKEYIASHVDKKGVLILSEMAGAINELADAVAVNPYSIEEMVNASIKALTMDAHEQLSRNERMHLRLKDYDVLTWAQDNIEAALRHSTEAVPQAVLLDQEREDHIMKLYTKARSRLFLLDYDGTLAPFVSVPEMAKPTLDLLQVLSRIAAREGNKIVIVSGRDRKTLGDWFNGCNIALGADFGAWVKGNGQWQMLQPFDKQWKKRVRPIMEKYATKLPLSFIEEKECAMVWDYRRADPELSGLRIRELTDEPDFQSQLSSHVDFLLGKNTFIIRNTGSGKSDAVNYWMKDAAYDFILAIGDDDVDEELFSALPPHAHTVKVGSDNTLARFYTPEQYHVVNFLRRLGAGSETSDDHY